LIQINHTTRRAEQHRYDAVAAGCSSGDAGAAIYVQHIHPDSFRIKPAFGAELALLGPRWS
jgi:hypothetical protein